MGLAERAKATTKIHRTLMALLCLSRQKTSYLDLFFEAKSNP